MPFIVEHRVDIFTYLRFRSTSASFVDFFIARIIALQHNELLMGAMRFLHEFDYPVKKHHHFQDLACRAGIG
jgi:hypothetical protein